MKIPLTLEKENQKQELMVAGMLSLTSAILLLRYVNSGSTVDFFEGTLFGVSIGLNLLYLVKQRIR